MIYSGYSGKRASVLTSTCSITTVTSVLQENIRNPYHGVIAITGFRHFFVKLIIFIFITIMISNFFIITICYPRSLVF